jgi:hypothetical protein
MPHPVLDAAERFRRAALARERETATRLVQTYGRIYRNLNAQQTALEQSLTAIQAAGEQVGRSQAARLDAVRSLLNQVADEIGRWGQYADTEVSQAAQREILAGLGDSRNMVQAYFTSPNAQRAIAASFDMLPAEQIETMLGFLGQDSPLHINLTTQFSDAVVQQLEESLIDGIALGYNPRKVAREIVRRGLGVGLNWALTTARTAQLWSYREATRANYMANSDVVSGWIWYAQLDDRVCLSCVAQHGSRHGNDEVLNDHHNGRCVAIPDVPLARRLGIQLPEIQPGTEWFEGLPAAEQERRMGPAMYGAWRAGEFRLSDLTVEYEDGTYGTMRREQSLSGLLGDRARDYYPRR